MTTRILEIEVDMLSPLTWTACSEMRPDDDEIVLIAMADGGVDVGYIDGDMGWCAIAGGCVESEVTHWRPFPVHPGALQE